ncbi:hypothetical protein V6N13_124761 [Hibiscus sabdariffa]
MLMCGSDPVEDQNEDGSELGLTSNIEDMDVKVVQYHGDSRKVQRIFEVMFSCCLSEDRLIDSQCLAKKLRGASTQETIPTICERFLIGFRL